MCDNYKFILPGSRQGGQNLDYTIYPFWDALAHIRTAPQEAFTSTWSRNPSTLGNKTTSLLSNSCQSLDSPHPHPPDFRMTFLWMWTPFLITMAPKFKDGDVVFAFSGKWVSWAHTAVAYGTLTDAESFKLFWMYANKFWSCFSQCSHRRYFSALPQDCPKWTLWIPRRVVPLCLIHNRWSVPRALVFYGLHSYYLRYRRNGWTTNHGWQHLKVLVLFWSHYGTSWQPGLMRHYLNSWLLWVYFEHWPAVDGHMLHRRTITIGTTFSWYHI